MKTIGIIGGMSWESSAEYYRLINQQMKAWLVPTHSAELIMYSLDFHGVAQLELEERWDEFAMVLVDAAKRLERAGVEFILLASNTAHKAADSVQAEIKIPLLHIADASAEAIAAAGIHTVGLGTEFVMQQDFIETVCVAEASTPYSPAKTLRKVRISRGRSDRCSSPCSTPPRSHARTSPSSRAVRRPPRWLGAGSSSRRRGRRRCRFT